MLRFILTSSILFSVGCNYPIRKTDVVNERVHSDQSHSFKTGPCEKNELGEISCPLPLGAKKYRTESLSLSGQITKDIINWECVDWYNVKYKMWQAETGNRVRGVYESQEEFGSIPVYRYWTHQEKAIDLAVRFAAKDGKLNQVGDKVRVRIRAADVRRYRDRKILEGQLIVEAELIRIELSKSDSCTPDSKEP